MIYEETYHYLLRNVSSTEFDTCLYSLLHIDWEGVVQRSLHQMAPGIGTTKNIYIKHLKNFRTINIRFSFPLKVMVKRNRYSDLLDRPS